jgi:hypothetical protein
MTSTQTLLIVMRPSGESWLAEAARLGVRVQRASRGDASRVARARCLRALAAMVELGAADVDAVAPGLPAEPTVPEARAHLLRAVAHAAEHDGDQRLVPRCQDPAAWRAWRSACDALFEETQ